MFRFRGRKSCLTAALSICNAKQCNHLYHDNFMNVIRYKHVRGARCIVSIQAAVVTGLTFNI